MNCNDNLRVSVVRRRLCAVAGFTLIELMIVVAIIAILAALAYPSYTRYIVRTHRVAAESCLSELSNYMERYYTTNLNYAKAENAAGTGTTANTLPLLDCAHQTSQNYSYTLASASTSAYVVDATPINAQLTRDTKCGVLSLDQAGQRGKGGTGTLKECWGS
ncbi:MAG TPA: type IV pilin protein [Rhodanobacteraceae bacterium]